MADRAELEDFWQSWLDTNRKAQELGDRTILADFYAPDAGYGWSYTPDRSLHGDGPSGEPYEIKGLGCSWFRYAGQRQWAWQRDIFDFALAR